MPITDRTGVVYQHLPPVEKITNSTLIVVDEITGREPYI